MPCNCRGDVRFHFRYFLLLVIVVFVVDSPAQLDRWNQNNPVTRVDSSNNVDLEKINSVLQSENSPQKKSVTKAFFFSLLVPGLGESYVGHSGYTKFFLTVEAAGWGIYLANYWQVAAGMEDYKNYAVQHAGLDRSGKDAQYWINIGKYDTIYEYNEQRRRDRDPGAIYNENTQNFWRWDTYNDRLYYDSKRIQTRELERKQVYIIGGLVLNHLVSAINSLRLARIHNRHAGQIGWNVQVSINPYQPAAMVKLCKTF